MPGAHPSRPAVDAFLRALGEVTGCVTKQLLATPTNRYDPAVTHAVTFGREGAAVSLRGAAGPRGLLLDVVQRYRIVEPTGAKHRSGWHVMTAGYEYRVLDHDQRELLVFHWQPGPDFAGPDHPHLHVSASLNARVTAMEERPLPLDKRHIPTGPISLAAVVRMLVVELGIEPIAANWHARLARTEAFFRRLGTRTDW